MIFQKPCRDILSPETLTNKDWENTIGALRARAGITGGLTTKPTTIDATFRGACLFRYAPDRKDSVEDYFTTGDRFVTTVNNTIRVWMSNANALKLQVIGDGRTESIEVGRPGQVLVQDIKWIKDYDGKYKLVVLEVD